MSRDVDEDAIEATIRRVTASNAASRPQPAADEAEPEPSAAATNLIDATIRRVAASKAAGRAQEAVDDARAAAPDDPDPIEATIRRVAASAAAARAEAAAEGSTGQQLGVPDLYIMPSPEPTDLDVAPEAAAERPPIDESLIEATLRRIEAEQTARATADTVAAGEAAAVEVEPWGSEAPGLEPRRMPAPAQVDAVEIERWAADVAPEPEIEPAAPVEFPSADAGWADVADALRRDLDEMKRQLRELSGRVESLFGGQSAPQPLRPTHSLEMPPKKQTTDDEWDDAPQVPRIPLGTAPRPAIVRNSSPHTATAAQLEDLAPEPAPPPAPKPADVAEAAAPAPPRTQAKRAFDLLPRTYRITVEDKRRGVDLVPLHRALLGLDGVRDMSLLSYSNGTAIVALETANELDPNALAKAVSHAMAREVKVEVHNEQTMVIKLAED